MSLFDPCFKQSKNFADTTLILAQLAGRPARSMFHRPSWRKDWRLGPNRIGQKHARTVFPALRGTGARPNRHRRIGYLSARSDGLAE